jgi:hypothetical protein
MNYRKILLRILVTAPMIFSGSGLKGQVRMWEGMLTLPTYEPKAADRNPMFYVPDAYQGAKRVIYPYPLMDNLSTVRSEKEYRAVYLENEYI